MLTKYLLAAALVFQACLATPPGLDPRITDGVDAKPGEFPYQVSVQWGIPPIIPYRHICGGSILNENFILTAGHCIFQYGSYKILAGKYNINKKEPIAQECDVEKVMVHEDYNGGTNQHDIALLKLKSPLVLDVNKRTAAIALPTANEKRTGQAVLIGWGSVSKGIFPVNPEILQKATVPVLDSSTCIEEFRKKPSIVQPKIYDTQICTGAAGEKSACFGDSGGPLAQFDENGPVQIGVVTWSVYPCGVIGLPTVYTSVPRYVDWIQEHMK